MIIYKKEHVVFTCDENEEWQAEDGAQSVHPLTVLRSVYLMSL